MLKENTIKSKLFAVKFGRMSFNVIISSLEGLGKAAVMTAGTII
jgi:hypothetical protein